MVAHQHGLGGLLAEGIIGLAPVNYTDPRDTAKPELFIDVAFNQGAIDERVFSLLIGADKKKQVFTIGGYDLAQFAKGDLIWHDCFSDEYWSVRMDGFKYGDDALRTTHNEAIVDSGTSYLIMPEANFMEVFHLVS